MPSIFTTISKSIGLQGELIDLPTKEKAEQLYKDVAHDRSEESFKEVFKLYRFGKSPESFAQIEISNLITDAFNAGSKIFR